MVPLLPILVKDVRLTALEPPMHIQIADAIALLVGRSQPLARIHLKTQSKTKKILDIFCFKRDQ